MWWIVASQLAPDVYSMQFTLALQNDLGHNFQRQRKE